MKSNLVLGTVAMTFVIVAMADEQITAAVEDVIRCSCVTNRRVASSIPSWGVPDRLLKEPSFTNLVNVVRSRIDLCPASFVCEMTNAVHKEIFIAALAECGPDTYRNALVRWFGGALPSGVSPDVVDHFASPVCPSMYGYFIRHYDDPGVSNVWLNIKSLYLASSNTVNAAGIDEILSGEARRYFDDMDEIERSLRER